MSLAIVIPWRTDNGPRKAAWDFLCPLWKEKARDLKADLLLCDDGQQPFSVARIVNDCIRTLKHDAVMLYGADQFPDALAIADAREKLETQPWTHVFGSVAYLTQECSRSILDGEQPAREFAETQPLAPGLLMYRREAWEDIGGYDERFVGWGYGDTAQLDALNVLHPIPPGAPQHQLVELWHPRSQPGWVTDRTAVNPNYGLYYDLYAPATGNRERMRAVVDEWKAERPCSASASAK